MSQDPDAGLPFQNHPWAATTIPSYTVEPEA
jgi:hypothetical protein